MSIKYKFLAASRRSSNFKAQLERAKQTVRFNRVTFARMRYDNKKLVSSLETESYDSYAKKRFIKHGLNFSKSAAIEINNSCNINCAMCDTKSSPRQKQLMDLDLFENTVIALKGRGVDSVTLHTIGDPLANPKISQVFGILRKHKLHAGFLSTNGLLLTKHLDTLVEYRDIVGNLRLSVDGATKATYERIRVGGNWEELEGNIECAHQHLIPKGYEFYFDFTLTLGNFSEIGMFLTKFRKYTSSIYNINFHFMNSLSPNNTFFNLNNCLPEHTYQNSFCKSVSSFKPYILVDGQVSACCRDYDGSLVVGSIQSNSGLLDVENSLMMSNLKSATFDQSLSMNNFPLCATCFVVDSRVCEIWNNASNYIKFTMPNGTSDQYQNAHYNLFSALRNKQYESKTILLR